MMTIALPTDLEKRVNDEASRQGLNAGDFVRKLILERLPTINSEESLADLFAEWNAEDGTNDPAELARRELEFNDFKSAMNRNRAEMEGQGSRKLFP